MASFFENLGRKITSAGQGVAQQTKNFAEVTKLNGAISDREKKMNALFMEIGRIYYAQHKEDMDCDQQQKVAQIRDMEAEIAQLQEQIKQVRGYTKCAVCGNDVPNGAKFCNACGSLVEEPVYNQPSMKVCPSCGAQIAEDCLFCTSCGYRMTQPEPQQPVQPEVQYTQPAQYAQPEVPQYAQPQPFVQTPQDIPQFQPAQPQDIPQFRPAQPQQDPNAYDPNNMM